MNLRQCNDALNTKIELSISFYDKKHEIRSLQFIQYKIHIHQSYLQIYNKFTSYIVNKQV